MDGTRLVKNRSRKTRRGLDVFIRGRSDSCPKSIDVSLNAFGAQTAVQLLGRYRNRDARRGFSPKKCRILSCASSPVSGRYPEDACQRDRRILAEETDLPSVLDNPKCYSNSTGLAHMLLSSVGEPCSWNLRRLNSNTTAGDSSRNRGAATDTADCHACLGISWSCWRFTYFEYVLAVPERQERRLLVQKGRGSCRGTRNGGGSIPIICGRSSASNTRNPTK